MVRFRHLALIFLFLSPAAAAGSMEKGGSTGLYCHAYEDGTYLCEFGYSFKEDAFVFSAEDC